MTVIPCSDPNLVLSPYTWKALDTRIEAGMPGAYVKAVVKGASRIGMVIDGTDNTVRDGETMPTVAFSVDDGPIVVQELARVKEVYTLSLAEGLDVEVAHRVEFYFRAANLGQNRWMTSESHLRLGGIEMDEGGLLLPCPKRAKTAIAFGDSITEGVGVDSKFIVWTELSPNNALGTWFPILCSALDCEYGQFGSGGQGMVREGMQMPPLPVTWDRYDPQTSRLTGGLLLPEPDYVFCAMGQNDLPEISVTEAYTEWLAAVRKACPHSRIFCIVPLSQVHRDEIAAAVEMTRDKKVYLIDMPELARKLFNPAAGGATAYCYDQAHPTQLGQAIYGANVAARVQKIIDGV